MAEDDEGGMPASWPQPHEGIRGADRDDWLLSLDERAVTHREALIAMAAHLSTATLVGAPAPVVARMNERLRRPEPGDLAAAREDLPETAGQVVTVSVPDGTVIEVRDAPAAHPQTADRRRTR